MLGLKSNQVSCNFQKLKLARESLLFSQDGGTNGDGSKFEFIAELVGLGSEKALAQMKQLYSQPSSFVADAIFLPPPPPGCCRKCGFMGEPA